MADAPAHPRADDRRRAFRWELLVLLWFAYFLNQADRSIFNVALPLIRADLGFSDTQMGLIATTFMVAFGLFVPIAGVISDRVSRSAVVVASLLIFSGGTLLTGVATSYLLLLLFRGLATGGGEAFYSPAAHSWIAEHHQQTRARALSVHQTANYTGVILGSYLAGWLAETFGWRAAFSTFGVAGLVWAGVIWRRTRGLKRAASAAPRPAAAPRASFAEALATIAGQPLLLSQVVGFAGLIFLLTGYMTWMPTMLYERFGMSLADAGFSAVVYHHLLAATGLFSSVVTDRLVGRFPKIRLYAMASALIACAPFVWIVGSASSLPVVYASLAAFGLFRGIYDANLYAGIFDLVEDRLRASVAGMVIAIAFVVGAFSPLLMGMVKSRFGLEGGLQLVAVIAGVIGLLYLIAALFGRIPARQIEGRDI